MGIGMKIEDLTELMQRDEPLHPDLKEWVVKGKASGGIFLNAPLVQEMFFNPKKCALINLRYKHKQECIAKYTKARDIGQYVAAHERPYRLFAFDEGSFLLNIPDRKYWQTLSWAWTDSENIWQNKERWMKLWNSKRSTKRAVMNAKEFKTLANLPDTVVVYRGLNREPNDPQGLSWTLSLDRAKWFAQRYSGIQKVIGGVVKKEDIHAVMLGRNEDEVVSEKVTITAESVDL